MVLESVLVSFFYKWLTLQSCLTLCNPMDCSPPGSSVHGIFQARVLEWGTRGPGARGAASSASTPALPAAASSSSSRRAAGTAAGTRGPGSGSAHSRVRTAPGTERVVVAPGPLPLRGPPRRVPPGHLPQTWAPLRSRAPLPMTPGTASRAPALGNPRETRSGLHGLRNRLPDPAAARVSFHALATGKLRAGAPRTPFSCLTCLSYRLPII